MTVLTGEEYNRRAAWGIEPGAGYSGIQDDRDNNGIYNQCGWISGNQSSGCTTNV